MLARSASGWGPPMTLLLTVKHDFDRLAATLDDFGRKQLPFASALALTRTAGWAKTDLRLSMKNDFDQPRPFTLNSLYTQAATKTRLEANVHFKDRLPKSVPAGRYLRAQIEGGARTEKSSERAFQRADVIPPGYFFVPTKYADLDAAGNMSAGQVKKILSYLGAAEGMGWAANYTGNSKGKRKNEHYFAVVPGRPQGNKGQGGGLPPAIYKVIPSGLGRIVVPVATIVPKAPTYTQRFDFYGIAAQSIERRLPKELGDALEHALRTARP